MNHKVSVQETGQVLFNVTVRMPIERGQEPYLAIVAPLGFYLVDGLSLTIGSAVFATLPIVRCDANGCYAGAVLTKDQLAQLKRGDALTIAFAPAVGQTANIAIPLSGFTTAFESIAH